MNLFGIKFRLTILVLAMALMGSLIAFVTIDSQQRGGEMRAKLGQVDAESLGIAEHFKDALREGSDKLTRYRNTHDPAAWQDFLKSSRDLNAWIQAEIGAAKTPREQAILKEMSATYADYVRVSADVQKSIQATPVPANPAGDLTDTLAQTRRHLFDLGQDLSQAHLDLKKDLLGQAHVALARLRWSVLIALGLLFVFGIALGVFVYRDMIAPLRRKLVENQAQLEQHEKLASLGLLAAGVAHEIRNPLTAIRAALFTQQRKFRPDSPEFADVKIVEREILRLERIVGDFLQFARPGEPEPTVIPADLLLLETKLFFSPQLAKNNIEIKLEPAAPLRISVDTAQIKQVLINLVQNAADSIGQDGCITLRARQERRHLPNGGKSAVILEVADTGKGMPLETQKRLFDPFFTTKENGTGLGLSIASRIVQKHGGVLEYQTQVKRGTTFGIILPEVTT